MIQQKLLKLQQAIQSFDKDKMQLSIKVDEINLMSSKMSKKARKHDIQSLSSSRKKRTSSQIGIRNQIIKNQIEFSMPISMATIKKLYESRCHDLQIEGSETGWEGFLNNFLNKNKTKSLIDFSGFNLKEKSFQIINEILKKSHFSSINLSRNVISFKWIPNLRYSKHLQELYLVNCNMHNEELEELFDILINIPIKVLNISSPDVKHRNTLTRYTKLSSLIIKSKTLHHLEVSNIQISPDCPIFLDCSKSQLKKLNISKNTKVCGTNKNLIELDLSWNYIENYKPLVCKDSKIQKLNLTGNPIPYYVFQQFLTTVAYPSIIELNLSKIVLNQQAQWLEAFVDKSHNLERLYMVQCQLSKSSFTNILYGIQNSKTLKQLNISKNKFPIDKPIAQMFSRSLQKSTISKLFMHECEINDDSGSVMFSGIRNCLKIQFIDLSKNYLSVSSGNKFCEQLRKGCFGLTEINFNQNMIKYDQLKQIFSYLQRNVYIGRQKIQEQYKNLKNLSTSNQQLTNRIIEAEKQRKKLQNDYEGIQKEFENRLKETHSQQIQMMERQIEIIQKGQSALKNKIEKIEQQLENIEVEQDQQI